MQEPSYLNKRCAELEEQQPRRVVQQLPSDSTVHEESVAYEGVDQRLGSMFSKVSDHQGTIHQEVSSRQQCDHTS